MLASIKRVQGFYNQSRLRQTRKTKFIQITNTNFFSEKYECYVSQQQGDNCLYYLWKHEEEALR